MKMEYRLYDFYGKTALLVHRQGADFDGTGMDLTGILEDGETIEEWYQRCAERRVRSWMEMSNWEIQKIKGKVI